MAARFGARVVPSFRREDGWAVRAGCRGVDREIFFAAGRGARGQVERALALCALCPVREACLEHAVTAPERFGIWGGTTARERGWNNLGKPLAVPAFDSAVPRAA